MASNLPLKRSKKGQKQGYKSVLKLVGLMFLLLALGAGLSLVQASMLGKKAFWARLETFINFANPSKRFVYIYAGMRREEIVEKYSSVLNWDDKDKRWFLASAPADAENGGFQEGYFFPKSYVVDKDASGQEVGEMMHQEFLDVVSEKVLDKEVLPSKTVISTKSGAESKGTASEADSKSAKSSENIDLDLAVRIASIIQREAAGPHDMRLISGIIWNRIFKGMTLDLDATLQYIKGTEEEWWPMVRSKDRYADSPYNTYKYLGVPPGAISNPSIEAIQAVYNPQKTDCIFYLHDNNRKIHCSKTYAEHVQNIDTYLR